jgi:VIT1/CCC1 family predicted Fe2+/Mn2+ transporter
MRRKRPASDYVRSSFFGIEDSLVSTTGLIAGVAVGTQDPKLVILAGVVGVAVEAVSMAAGEFLSEETTQDLAGSSKGKKRTSPLLGGFIMLISYGLAGMVPLLPIMFVQGSMALPCQHGSGLSRALFAWISKGHHYRQEPITQRHRSTCSRWNSCYDRHHCRRYPQDLSIGIIDLLA